MENLAEGDGLANLKVALKGRKNFSQNGLRIEFI